MIVPSGGALRWSAGMAMLRPVWQTTMDEVASHGVGSLGLRYALRCKAICPADSELEAIGSLSNFALGIVLRFYRDPDSIGYSGVGTMNDSTILARKLVDVWAWLFFATNTSMTMSIIYKIL
jgi:hypothetical protein